jgi:SAM-dependent methyltransferase
VRNHLDFIGPLSPFLEIGSNVGHTSYMLCNEFGAEGFALDLSADSLRYGVALMDCWGLERAPVRIAGDAAKLPFQDGSLRMVLAFQMLSQFMDIESVFLEAKRVLAPGGVFLFAEEPLRRLLTLRLYRAPYYNRMKSWERRLHDAGLLGFLVRDVIGAEQEESFGIRQNHSLYLRDWHRLVEKHFAAHEYEIVLPDRGPAERWIKRAATWWEPSKWAWRSATLLGGTLAAICRKAGDAPPLDRVMERFEQFLRCPDCGGKLSRDAAETLHCARCGYEARNESGVYTVLPSAERAELYPGDREDIIDMSLPGHERRLVDGWHELEGVFGGKFRWIGPRAAARLTPVRPGRQRLRIRGHAHERPFQLGMPVRVEVSANGARAGEMALGRPGLFVFEADLPDAPEYRIEIEASPVWHAPPDRRDFTVHLSMLRLVPRE